MDSLEIKWNVQGKVDTVLVNREHDKQMLVFRYDGNGNRVRKQVHKSNIAGELPNDSVYVTHYVRDAQGNIMSVYERKTTGYGTGSYIVGFYQKEVPLYGSDRIGEYQPDSLLWEQEVELSEEPYYQPPSGMPVADAEPDQLLPVQGFQASTVHGGMKAPTVSMHKLSPGEGDLPDLSSEASARLDGLMGVNSSSVSNNNGNRVLTFNCYRHYNGHANVSMLLDERGELLQNSNGIKAVWSGQSAMMPRPGHQGQYLLFTVGEDDIVYQHQVDAASKTVLAKNLPLTDEGYGQNMLLLEDYSGEGSKLFIRKQGKLQAITIDSEGQVSMPEDLATYSETAPAGPMSLSADGSRLAVALHQGTKQVYPESYQTVQVIVYDIGNDRSSLSLNTTLSPASNARITSLSFSPAGSSYLYYSLQNSDGSTNTHRVMPSNHEQEQLLASTGMVSRTKGGMIVGQGTALKLITNADATTVTTTTLASGTNTKYKTTGKNNILKYDFDFVPKNGIFAWKVGKKVYELKDHLGNVRSLIKDYRADDGSGNAIAALEHYAHYYPFGMMQPGRNGNRYRFGFNGMEKDDEVKGTGNSYTTLFRQYDPRLGRWLSKDPVIHSFQSSYCSFDNNPVRITDPSGADGDPDESTGTINATIYFRFDEDVSHLSEAERLAYIQNFRESVREHWNGRELANGQTVDVDNVQFLLADDYGITSQSDLGRYENLITVGNGANARDDAINGSSYIDNNFLRNTGYMYYANGGREGGHEFGHMLGLSDRYYDAVYIDIERTSIYDSYDVSRTHIGAYTGEDYDPGTNLMTVGIGFTGQTSLSDKQLKIAFTGFLNPFGRSRERDYTKGGRGFIQFSNEKMVYDMVRIRSGAVHYYNNGTLLNNTTNNYFSRSDTGGLIWQEDFHSNVPYLWDARRYINNNDLWDL